MNSNIPIIGTTKVLKKIIVFTLIFTMPSISFSQYSAQVWKRFKNEAYFGSGATAYLGDLGGGVESGNHSLSNINPEATKFIISAGFRSKLTEFVSFRLDFSYGQASGADSLTQNVDRKARNLSFRTNFITTSPIIEVYFVPEQFGRGASPFSMYAASGLRMMYFNPKAQLNNSGEWYDLQPLGTEGQLAAGKAPYSRFVIGLPLIVGMKLALPSSKGGKDGAWTIGLETSANWLMTDYFDDVSTTYASPEAIQATSGSIGVALANKKANASLTGEGGGIRGNPTHNDWYGTIQVIIGKQLYTSSRGRRRKSPSRGSYF